MSCGSAAPSSRSFSSVFTTSRACAVRVRAAVRSRVRCSCLLACAILLRDEVHEIVQTLFEDVTAVVRVVQHHFDEFGQAE
jgi:hypothetical protein